MKSIISWFFRASPEARAEHLKHYLRKRAKLVDQLRNILSQEYEEGEPYILKSSELLREKIKQLDSEHLKYTERLQKDL